MRRSSLSHDIEGGFMAAKKKSAIKKKLAAKKKSATKKKTMTKKTAAKKRSAPKRAAVPKQKSASRKKTAGKKKAAAKKKIAGRRELIDTGTNKLFVRRNERGTSFKKVVDAGKSIARDRRTKAKRKVASGQGDKGDRR